MDKIKKAIIILLIGVAIIIGVLIVLKGNIKQEEEKKEVENFDIGKTFENNSNGFQIVDDGTIFFTITNILNQYLSALNYDNEEITNTYNIQNQEEQKEIMLALLDKQYIDKNGIEEYRDKIQYNYNLIPIDIRVKYDENIITYILNVYFENSNTLQLENKYYIIRTDNQNASFSVEPVREEENDIDQIAVEDNQNRIEPNDYNKYQIETISIERLVKIYMSQFINMMLNHTEIAYNQYLNDEYKEKRFGSSEQWKEYVEKNREELKNVRATQYLIENEEDTKKYVIKDQYQNIYEFYEASTMSYKVKLDTYTIPTEKFKTTYQNANERDKVLMNIDKWVQMLNNRDYLAAYNVLDETYRSNTFGTEEAFEERMREILPLHYEIEYNDFSEEGKTTITTITLKDATKETEESKEMSIFMQLKEDLDFVMSFNISS